MLSNPWLSKIDENKYSLKYLLLGMPIPRQFHSSEIQRLGEWQFVFVIPRESGKLKPIPWVSGSGIGGILGSIFFQIWSQYEISFYWKEFFLFFIFNLKEWYDSYD